MGNRGLGVGLELDPLLEVDQVEFHFVGAVAERQVDDQHVQERGLARAGLAGDQHVLRRALAELEVLELADAGPAHGNVDPLPTVGGPPLRLFGGDPLEGQLDAPGVAGLVADATHQVGELLGRGRMAQEQPDAGQVRVVPGELPVAPGQLDRVAFQVGELELAGKLQGRVEAHQRVDPATGAAGHDAQQPVPGRLRKIRGKIGHHEDAVRLGQLAGRFVVVLDRLVFVAEIDLDHVLHVLGQFPQAPLDVARLRPDPVGDELLVEIGQVHEGGEVLAQTHRIDDQEADLAGGKRGQHAEHHRLYGLDGLESAVAAGLHQQQRTIAEGEHRGG